VAPFTRADPLTIHPATQRQLRYLQTVAKEAGLDGAALDERSVREFNVKAAAVSRRQASELINILLIEAQERSKR
jgi:hypothetical protein